MRLLIQSLAEDDIIRQVAWYAERGLPEIARRFIAATRRGTEALLAMPPAGAPKRVDNPMLAGLRSWPLQGFEEFRIYYLVQPDELCVVRVLHGSRDVGAILTS